MSRLRTRLLIGAGLTAVMIGLAACNDDKTASTPTTPMTPQQRFIAFGQAFANAFDASATTEAKDANPGDAPALTLTAEPSEVA